MVVFRIECRLQVKVAKAQMFSETFRGFATLSRRLHDACNGKRFVFVDGFVPGSGITTPGPSGAAWNSFQWVCDVSQESFRFQSAFQWHRQMCVSTGSMVVFRIECRLQVKATKAQLFSETFRGLCDAVTTPSRRLQWVTICF
jgi:hypothetical protein